MHFHIFFLKNVQSKQQLATKKILLTLSENEIVIRN